MAQRLVILGAGGHAKMVIEAARTQGIYEPLLCLAQDLVEPDLLGVPIELESEQALLDLQNSGAAAFVAVGCNRLRQRLAQRLSDRGVELACIVSAQAWVSPSAKLGPGTVIMPGAIVGACARIGEGVILNTAASVDHDCRIDDFAHIAPGCHLAGNVTVEAGSFLGVGVSVIPEKTIGAGSIVGAGAVVISSVPAGQTWIGCPARLKNA